MASTVQSHDAVAEVTHGWLANLDLSCGAAR